MVSVGLVSNVVASCLVLSLLIRAKFRRKWLLALMACDLVGLVWCHSVSNALNSSPCGNVLCLHGTCSDGRCVCDRGWHGSACHLCVGRILLTQTQGYISDGMGNYTTDHQCTWLIDSGHEDAKIRLEFVEFETECSWDHLYIFDGDSVFSPLIASYSGLLVKSGRIYQSIPEIVAHSGRAYLYFYSDAAYNMSGFNISYSINSCPKNCSKHGACIGSECTCSAGWEGEACDVSICPNNCSRHGTCDKQNHKCLCDGGYIGVDCSQVMSQGYWVKQMAIGSIRGRSLHRAVVVDDSMWIVGGEWFDLTTDETNSLVLRFDFRLRKWEKIEQHPMQPEERSSHSLAAYDKRLYLYGGILHNGTVTNELWRFDTVSHQWNQISDGKNLYKTCSESFCSPLTTMGHTATVVDNVMIVIFGHNPIYGYLNTVQEYNFITKRWMIADTRGALVKGGYGHTSEYDSISKIIYVHGGYHSSGSDTILVDLIYGYNPSSKKWTLLNPSQSARYLHSSVVLNGVMLVFGGNGHNASHDTAGDKCFSPHFMLYDIMCDSWMTLKDPVSSLLNNEDVGRYGHTGVVYEDAMYIFGGFNGIMLNSILKFTPGSCGHHKTQDECVRHKPGVKCIWHVDKRTCQPLTKSQSSSLNAPCSRSGANFTDLCQRQTTCPNCVENSYECVWCSDSCHYQKCKKPGIKAIGDLSRCDEELTSNCNKLHNCHYCHTEHHCGWQRDHKCYTFVRDNMHTNKTEKATTSEEFRPSCDVPCYKRDTCINCTQGPCMWCSSLNRCIESNAYPAAFPIAQCMEWTIRTGKCPGFNCSDIKTCDKCQQNPRCGWCDDGTDTGVGKCMEGSSRAPYQFNGTHYSLWKTKCQRPHWHFTDCPKCQCNGHSSCKFDSGTCVKPCGDLSEGDHCEYCTADYYGDPVNGGRCTPCFCHNHSLSCHRETGKCDCTTKGIIGDRCEKCDEQNHYVGNPTEDGGSCFYNLTVDFQYTFNMSKSDDKHYTRINFMNVPMKPDVDVDFSIQCSESALVNISIRSPTFPFRSLFERLECGNFKLKFSHEENSFAVQNTTFYVNVFGFSTPFILQISFSQHRTLDLLQFFVTFSSCFLTLLIIAAILWKIKQKYDLYRRRQQLFVEMEQMASRPFAGVVVEVEPELLVEGEEDPFLPSKDNNPTPIALEPCSNGKAAVLSLILRLPTGGCGAVPPGQTGLAIASAIVSLGSIEHKLTKELDLASSNKIINAAKCSSPTGL